MTIPAYAGSRISARKPRVGFLGAGWIGRMRLKSLVESGAAELAAIADSSPEALAQARQIAPGALATEDLGRLLETELDGVVIATPSALHAEQAAAALRRGLAVFCENRWPAPLRKVVKWWRLRAAPTVCWRSISCTGLRRL
jgi:threonine dehydrogenase-like Zn-dependent dehydrogenase